MNVRSSQNKILVLILILVLLLAVALPPLAIADRDGNPEKGNDNPPAQVVAGGPSQFDIDSSNQGQGSEEKGRPDNGNPGQDQAEPNEQKPEVPPGLVENPGRHQGEGNPDGSGGNPNGSEGNPGVGQKPEPLPEPQGAPPQSIGPQDPGQGNGQPNIQKPDPPRGHTPPSSPGSQGKGRDNPHRGQPKGNESAPKGNEGVGQTPEHSQKQNARMIQVIKEVVGTYNADKTAYSPPKTGGGDGQRWMAVPQGGFINYRITIINNGSEAISNLILWDKIPSKTTFNSESHPAEATLSQTTEKQITWTLPILNGGDSKSFILWLKVDDNAPINHVITNVAKTNYGPAAECQVRVVGARPAPPVTPSAARLDIQKSVDKVVADPNNVLTYTISYTNTGSKDLTGVKITDWIPTGTVYKVGSASAGATYNEASKILTWDIGTLPIGTSGQVSFQVEIVTNPPSLILNVARISSNETDPKEASAATSIRIPVSPGAYGLDFVKSVAQAFARPGDILDYTLYVENTGGQEFINIEIKDEIPANTTYFPGSATGGATLAGNTLIWRISSLKPGENRQFKFKVVVNPDAKGVIRNVAFFTSERPQTKRERAVETTVVVISPVSISAAGMIQPTPAVLILPAKKVPAAALPYTGADFLILYLIIALVFMVTGLAAQRLKT